MIFSTSSTSQKMSKAWAKTDSTRHLWVTRVLPNRVHMRTDRATKNRPTPILSTHRRTWVLVQNSSRWRHQPLNRSPQVAGGDGDAQLLNAGALAGVQHLGH